MEQGKLTSTKNFKNTMWEPTAAKAFEKLK